MIMDSATQVRGEQQEKEQISSRMSRALKQLASAVSAPPMMRNLQGSLARRAQRRSSLYERLDDPVEDSSALSSERLREHDGDSAINGLSWVPGTTYYTAQSRMGTQSVKAVPGQLCESDEYARILRRAKLWPVPSDLEQNWSRRGQHAKFDKGEESLLNEILQVQDTLGHTRTAFVQSVKCQRILLARKTITCGKSTLTKDDAVKEVAHLSRLSHAHIIRVIGTYVKGRELSILLYPVAEYNLEDFINEYQALAITTELSYTMETAAKHFLGCLSSAVRHIHARLTKHMDIKPQNVLIRATEHYPYHSPLIADFGIARSYQRPEDVETDGRTMFTKRYAAPEVIRQDVRGLPADIFSLGCVFLEIYTVFQRSEFQVDMQNALKKVFDTNEHGDRSYAANLDGLKTFLTKYSRFSSRAFSIMEVLPMVAEMLNDQPLDRPSAKALKDYFGWSDCCRRGPLPLKDSST